MLSGQPGGTTKGQLLTEWIQQQSVLLGMYDKEFAQWIYSTDSANNTNNASERSLIENMLIAGGLAFFPVDLPAAVPVAMLEAAIVGWLQPMVDTYLNNTLTGGGPDPQQAMTAFLGAEEYYAKLQLASTLFGDGQLAIWQNGQEIPISLESTGCSSDDQLLSWVLNYAGEIVVLTDTGGQKLLSDLLNAVGNQDSPSPAA